jgi:hypothetical protein
MKTCPLADPAAGLAFSLSAAETAVLLQRGGLLRQAAEAAAWLPDLRFFVAAEGPAGLLAFLPRAAIRPVLESKAAHAIEAEFKQRVFDAAAQAEWPDFCAPGAHLLPP